MIRARLLAPLAATVWLAIGARAQEWTDEQLTAACADFQLDALPPRLAQVRKLVAAQAQAGAAIATRIHGDHREYQLKIERLLGDLADPRWTVREQAERDLIEIGGRAFSEIQTTKQGTKVLDQQMRCARILDALASKGTEAEDRERRLLQGLVTTALYLQPDDRLRRALRSALGHTNAAIADGALRALGAHGGDDEATAVKALLGMPAGAIHRPAAIAALARMRAPAAAAACAELLFPGDGAAAIPPANRAEAMAIVRNLRLRSDDDAAALLRRLAQHPDPVVAAGASTPLPPTTQSKATARITLAPDRAKIEATIVAAAADALVVDGAFAEMPRVELTIGDCDEIEFPGHAAVEGRGARVFLDQGSIVRGDVLAIDAESVVVRTLRFGERRLPRRSVQGIAFDAALDRLIGGSPEHARLRLRDATFVDGELTKFDGATFTVQGKDGAARLSPLAEVSGLLFQRPTAPEHDALSYARFDLVDGERLIGFLAAADGEHVVVSVPLVGAVALPWRLVQRLGLAVGSGAMWGFTLVADYSDNRVVEIDEQGRVVFEMQDVFGAWDAECLDNGNLLLTEYLINRVQEVDRKGNQVWAFEDLKNPYDADRLPNGNTLIADTFAGRVIEVDPKGAIVWSYARDIRPFDVDRLPNGNTLIADVLKDRVLEITPTGETAWEQKGLAGIHDADRLPNGNTLVTSRSKGLVQELDRTGKVVFELTGLNSPSDADRLPNGNTIVAENMRVREFDRRGVEVWRQAMTWAVEVNRY